MAVVAYVKHMEWWLLQWTSSVFMRTVGCSLGHLKVRQVESGHKAPRAGSGCSYTRLYAPRQNLPKVSFKGRHPSFWLGIPSGAPLTPLFSCSQYLCIFVYFCFCISATDSKVPEGMCMASLGHIRPSKPQAMVESLTSK